MKQPELKPLFVVRVLCNICGYYDHCMPKQPETLPTSCHYCRNTITIVTTARGKTTGSNNSITKLRPREDPIYGWTGKASGETHPTARRHAKRSAKRRKIEGEIINVLRLSQSLSTKQITVEVSKRVDMTGYSSPIQIITNSLCAMTRDGSVLRSGQSGRGYTYRVNGSDK